MGKGDPTQLIMPPPSMGTQTFFEAFFSGSHQVWPVLTCSVAQIKALFFKNNNKSGDKVQQGAKGAKYVHAALEGSFFFSSFAQNKQDQALPRVTLSHGQLHQEAPRRNVSLRRPWRPSLGSYRLKKKEQGLSSVHTTIVSAWEGGFKQFGHPSAAFLVRLHRVIFLRLNWRGERLVNDQMRRMDAMGGV
ncbi:hypothetical protein BC940DRAFT_74512 [Gongronella butleri]|nr:hypothetical protein BC940DRAFT_74512 [Gongronella butleri]